MADKDERNPFTTSGTIDGIAAVDPAAIGRVETGSAGSAGDRGDSASAGAKIGKRKRGRPKGSRNKVQGEAHASLPVDRDAISAILFSLHTMLAAATHTPELALDESESCAMADAAAKVAVFYDITASAKAVAWANLATVVGAAYGPRFIAISIRKRKERAKRSDKVTPIRDGVMPPFEFPEPPKPLQ